MPEYTCECGVELTKEGQEIYEKYLDDERFCYCQSILKIEKLKKKLDETRKKLRDTKIAEGILTRIIWNDGWDLEGEKEDVMNDLNLTSREYNYLNKRFNTKEDAKAKQGVQNVN